MYNDKQPLTTPWGNHCTAVGHAPPTYIVIFDGEVHQHKCHTCGFITLVYPPLRATLHQGDKPRGSVHPRYTADDWKLLRQFERSVLKLSTEAI